jgi:hypothetical protein
MSAQQPRFTNAIECYQAIGALLAGAIPEAWTKIVVEATLDEEIVEIVKWYTADGDPTDRHKSFPYLPMLPEHLYDLARLVSSEEKGLYRSCQFILWPSGKYDVSFDYGA